MNFYRYIRRYRSDYVWRAMDPNQEGLMNQGGLLTGIQGITLHRDSACTPMPAPTSTPRGPNR